MLNALPEKIEFMGLGMHAWSMRETVDEIARRIDSDCFTQHVVVNVAKVIETEKDRDLHSAIEGCDIVNIDGMGVVWGARFLGCDIPERVAGCDLFEELLAVSAQRGYPVYFLGATQENLDRAIDTIRTRFPKLIISGSHHGYFWDDEKSVVDDIHASGAKLLFVAISSPMKEKFIDRWKNDLGVLFAMGVGGTFDIWAGATKRAPQWMQAAGLEWAYRLLQEPKRMFKRYMVSNSLFLMKLFAHKWKRSLASSGRK